MPAGGGDEQASGSGPNQASLLFPTVEALKQQGGRLAASLPPCPPPNATGIQGCWGVGGGGKRITQERLLGWLCSGSCPGPARAALPDLCLSPALLPSLGLEVRQNHKDYQQVLLDVRRSTCRFPPGEGRGGRGAGRGGGGGRQELNLALGFQLALRQRAALVMGLRSLSKDWKWAPLWPPHTLGCQTVSSGSGCRAARQIPDLGPSWACLHDTNPVRCREQDEPALGLTQQGSACVPSGKGGGSSLRVRLQRAPGWGGTLRARSECKEQALLPLRRGALPPAALFLQGGPQLHQATPERCLPAFTLQHCTPGDQSGLQPAQSCRQGALASACKACWEALGRLGVCGCSIHPLCTQMELR